MVPFEAALRSGYAPVSGNLKTDQNQQPIGNIWGLWFIHNKFATFAKPQVSGKNRY